jgi:hypothetical protein
VPQRHVRHELEARGVDRLHSPCARLRRSQRSSVAPARDHTPRNGKRDGRPATAAWRNCSRQPSASATNLHVSDGQLSHTTIRASCGSTCSMNRPVLEARRYCPPRRNTTRDRRVTPACSDGKRPPTRQQRRPTLPLSRHSPHWGASAA